jgi:hypothetical protein
MNRLVWITAATALFAAGCERKGPAPNPPTPTTQQELSLVMAETPATDPSLPSAAEALAAADAAAAAAVAATNAAAADAGATAAGATAAADTAAQPELENTRSALSDILARQQAPLR